MIKYTYHGFGEKGKKSKKDLEVFKMKFWDETDVRYWDWGWGEWWFGDLVRISSCQSPANIQTYPSIFWNFYKKIFANRCIHLRSRAIGQKPYFLFVFFQSDKTQLFFFCSSFHKKSSEKWDFNQLRAVLFSWTQLINVTQKLVQL